MPSRGSRYPIARVTAHDVARLLLLLLAFLAPLLGGTGDEWQTGLLALIVLAIAFLTLAPIALGRQGARLRPTVVDWAALAFLALSAAAMAWAPYRRAALWAVLGPATYFLCFWLARGLFTTAFWRRLLVLAVVAGSAVEGLIGVREFLCVTFQEHAAAWRVFGNFSSPNLTAGYFVVVLPLAVVLALSYLRLRQDQPSAARPLLVAAGGLMLAALILTGSKGGALAALGAALVLGWNLAPPGKARSRSLLWTLVAVLAAVALALLAPPVRSRLNAAFTTQWNSTAFRYYMWVGMLHMIHVRPLLGFGAGSFEWSFQRYCLAGFARAGHDGYLQVATEIGLPGAAAFLVLWIGLAAALVRRVQSATQAERALPAAALAGLTGFLLQTAVDNNWYCATIVLTLLLVIGVVLAPKATAEEVAPAPASWSLRAGAAVVMLGILPLAGWLALVQLPAQQLRAQAGHADDPVLAVTLMRQAWEQDPGDAHLCSQLAGIEELMGTPRALNDAIALREKVTQRMPLDSGNWRKLALLYMQAGQVQPALAAIRQALEAYPNYSLGLLAQARIAEIAGRPDLVKSSFERLSAMYDGPVGQYPALGDLMDPTYLYAWQYLAQDAKRHGDEAGAVPNWRKMAVLLTKYAQLTSDQRRLLRAIDLTSDADEQAFDAMNLEVVGGLRADGNPADTDLANGLLEALTAEQQAQAAEEKQTQSNPAE
jgi:O-antigen ligase/tetratricopeptide (TPR) repeat protein